MENNTNLGKSKKNEIVRPDNNQLFNSLEAAQGKKVHLTFFVIDVSIQ